MPSFLFWNLNGKQLHDHVGRLARELDVDFIALVEFEGLQSNMLRALNSNTDRPYSLGFNLKRGIITFTRFGPESLVAIAETDHMSVSQLVPPLGDDMIIAVAHCSSQMFRGSSEDGIAECIRMSTTIREAEKQVGHERTILVGDLNLDPFSPGVVMAQGLHAVMSREIAKKMGRTVQNNTYPYFYNPMWNHLGDDYPGPPGTYYFRDTGEKALFWRMFDQVLLRPSLLPHFDNRTLRIVTRIGETILQKPNGCPKHNEISDHFPIYFELSLKESLV